MAGRDRDLDKLGGDNDSDNENRRSGQSGAGSGVADAAAGVDALAREDMSEQLKQAQAQAAEYLDSWRRSAAELSNARKRMQREQAEFASVATARVLERLVPIVDDVERAFSSLPSDSPCNDWLAGFRLIQRKLESLLESEGVTAIPTEGRRFDPAVHYAVSHEVHPDYEEGEIIAEVSRGYVLGERVLRPSMVRVARAKDGAEASAAA